MSFTRSLTFSIAISVSLLQALSGYSQQSVFIPKKAGGRKTGVIDSSRWKSTGMLVLNVNQSAQSEWGSGGESFLLGINGIINEAIHHRKNKYTLDIYADIEMGMVKATSFKRIRKTTDRVDLTGEIEHRIGKKEHFNYSLVGNVNTQVLGGHNYLLDGFPKSSSFLSPGKFLLSFGIDYKYASEKSYLSVFISPTTIRWVTKIDDDFYNLKKFGVDPNDKVNTEIGAYFSVHFQEEFSKTARLSSRLDLFSNYKRNPHEVDILFNNIFGINIGKMFAATFIFDVLYDADFRKKTQIQEITGLGLRIRL